MRVQFFQLFHPQMNKALLGQLTDRCYGETRCHTDLYHQADHENHSHTGDDIRMILYNKFMAEYRRIFVRALTSLYRDHPDLAECAHCTANVARRSPTDCNKQPFYRENRTAPLRSETSHIHIVHAAANAAMWRSPSLTRWHYTRRVGDCAARKLFHKISPRPCYKSAKIRIYFYK